MKEYVTWYNFLLVFAFCISSNCLVAQQPTDCADAITVCGNSEINLDVNGIGLQELNGLNTCGSQENNSLWLSVTVVTNGTLGFTLTPNSSSLNEDYDFFVFGPNQSCNNLSTAIRCSTTNPQNAGLNHNLTGMNRAESDTSEGPGASGNSFVRWLDVNAGETYFIVIDRPIGNSPFSLEWTGTAEFASPPTNESGSSTALNIEACDVDAPYDDGFTDFDLTLNNSTIIGTQTDVTVSYFETESDANINTNPITGVYTNTDNPQEVYSRITNSATGCFEIIPFDLIVNLGPDFTPPTDYELCDNYDDGDNTNGKVIFNLSSKNNEILNGQDSSDINISYHILLAEAETNQNPLPNSYYNDTSDLEPLFVRIESSTDVNCYSTTTLNLVVLETPLANNSVQTQCSDSSTTLFNLTNSNETLTGNIADRSTLFFTNMTDALNNINAISTSGSYMNLNNPQILFVRVINDNTGCFSISELELRVSNTTANNTEIVNCDTDGTEDGFFEFDLTQANSFVLNGAPTGSTIMYFESMNDALLEINPLSLNYTNTQAFNQTVFARIETIDQCYGIAEVDLVVNTLPDIDTEDNVYYCLNTYPSTITIDSGNIALPSNYTYAWSTNESTFSIEVNETGIYTVVVTNLVTNCSKTRTISVEPSNIGTIDSIEIIDASDDNSITIYTSGEGEYEYALYNENGLVYPYQLNNSFNNIIPGIYTLHIRDIKNNCGVIEDTVSIIGFPKFFTPNGDGDNDYWKISGISTIFQPNSKILIFDRYGKLVKQLNPLGSGWDGTLNGELLPVSDYWFAATLQDGRVVKDHFTLKR